jgi:hypothetical protein
VNGDNAVKEGTCPSCRRKIREGDVVELVDIAIPRFLPWNQQDGIKKVVYTKRMPAHTYCVRPQVNRRFVPEFTSHDVEDAYNKGKAAAQRQAERTAPRAADFIKSREERQADHAFLMAAQQLSKRKGFGPGAAALIAFFSCGLGLLVGSYLPPAF